MSAAIVLAQTLIAVLAVIMLWPKASSRFKKTLIVSTAGLWVVAAALQYIHEGRVTEKQDKMASTQARIANSVSLLERNYESEEATKHAEARRNQEMRDQLQTFIASGAELRDKCAGTGQLPAERQWMTAVETYLSKVNRDNAMEFLRSTELVPNQGCFARINAHLWVLERIQDQIPQD